MTEASPGSDVRSGVRVGVVVPAAGSGRRMGGARKPFLELSGEPVLIHALRPFLADSRVVRVVVALAPGDAATPPDWLTTLDARVSIVTGGASRAESVARGIEALPEDVTVIAVHDAARPLVQEDVIRSCIDLVAGGVGAVAGCPAVDTIKAVDGEGRIVGTPDRSSLWHAHTPQVFPATILREAYREGGLREGGFEVTDDAALVERLGVTIRMVDDRNENLKVTHPGDVAVAEAILAARGAR